MTTRTFEDSQWFRNKTTVMEGYIGETRKLFSNVAGRGFLYPPGFMYEGQLNVEKAAKMKLSEINFKILEDVITREMKQAGLDYDVAFRNAKIQWEIDKQALMAAWDAELAVLKREQAFDEEVLNLLAIEVGKRAIALIEAKTAIDLEMEGYRKQLADLDGSTASQEVALAQAKLATAQSKLLIIPVLNQLIDKEYELIEAETEKIDAYSDLISAERTVIDRKESVLVPALETLNQSYEEYSGMSSWIIDLKEQIAAQRVARAEILAQGAVKNTELMEVFSRHVTALEELATKKTDTAAKFTSDVLPEMESYAEAAASYADKLPEMIDKKTELANIEKEIAEEEADQAKIQTDMAEIHVDIAGYAEELASLEKQKAQKQVEVTRKEVELVTAESSLETAKLALTSAKHSADISIAQKSAEASQTVASAKTALNSEIASVTSNADATWLANKTRAAETDLATKQESQVSRNNSQANTTYSIADTRSDEAREKVVFDAAPRLTAELTHLLKNA